MRRIPITYDSGTNTITVVGFSESSPCTFEDIYQADVDNGWGVFHKVGNGSYYSQAHINIGDGTTPTYFSDDGVNVELDNSMISSASRDFMRDFSNVNITFTNCNFLFKGELSTWGRLNLMRASFTRCTFINDRTFDIMIISNRVTQCLGKGVLFQPYGDVNYVITYGRMFDARTTDINIQNVFIFDSSTCLRTMNSDAIVQNIKGYNNIYCYYSTLSTNIARARYMINCYFDKWAIRLHTGTHPNDYAVFYRQYEVFLRTVDKDGNILTGYKIEVYDKNGNKVGEVISEEDYKKITLTYAKIDFKEKFPDKIGTNTYINAQEDDWDYYNPFTIKIWNGQELLYEGVLKDEDYLYNPPAYIDIVVNPSSFTLDDIMSELQSHRNAVEPNIDAKISSRLASNDSRLDNLDVPVSSRASQDSVDAIPTNPLLDNDPRLDNLDVPVSSRASQTSVDELDDKLKKHDTKMVALKFIG